MGSSKKKKKRPSAAGSGKQGSQTAGPRRKTDARADTGQRAGMPAQDSIISETTFTSPKGQVYRILKTDEMDEYDEPVSKQSRRKR